MMKRHAPVALLLAGMASGSSPAHAWDTTKEETFDGTWSVIGFAPSMDSECLGFSAPKGGAVGRCVLTDPEGDRIFCELNAAMSPGVTNVGGRFVAGTGKYEGITGTLRFQVVTGPQSPGKGSGSQTMSIFGSWRLP